MSQVPSVGESRKDPHHSADKIVRVYRPLLTEFTGLRAVNSRSYTNPQGRVEVNNPSVLRANILGRGECGRLNNALFSALGQPAVSDLRAEMDAAVLPLQDLPTISPRPVRYQLRENATRHAILAASGNPLLAESRLLLMAVVDDFSRSAGFTEWDSLKASVWEHGSLSVGIEVASVPKRASIEFIRGVRGVIESLAPEEIELGGVKVQV